MPGDLIHSNVYLACRLLPVFFNRQLSSVSSRTCTGFYNSGTLAFRKSTFGGRQVRLGDIQASVSTCMCMLACLWPYTVNFKWACLNLIVRRSRSYTQSRTLVSVSEAWRAIGRVQRCDWRWSTHGNLLLVCYRSSGSSMLTTRWNEASLVSASYLDRFTTEVSHWRIHCPLYHGACELYTLPLILFLSHVCTPECNVSLR